MENDWNYFDNPRRIKKLVKAKKRKTVVNKMWLGPGEKLEHLTDDELLDLKKHYFYNLRQYLLFPEFSTGCKECGGENQHREFCSIYYRNL